MKKKETRTRKIVRTQIISIRAINFQTSQSDGVKISQRSWEKQKSTSFLCRSDGTSVRVGDGCSGTTQTLKLVFNEFPIVVCDVMTG